MRKQLGVAFCAMLLLAGTARAQNPRKDEHRIRALAAHWQQNWNRDDPKALAGLLSADADYVTVDGTWLRGRAEFENWRAHIQPPAYRHSSWTNNQLTFRFLDPDIAILHIRWTINLSPAQINVPSRSRSGISTWILVKLGSGWKIRAAQNTETRQASH
ncbi:MAG TPA: SgcJ/EcaC family oxidoreductase [Patescibacteria group bacterium]|nr:SgcJ/EcaC family oxidoreductase [Patescibacteria group bacterium]